MNLPNKLSIMRVFCIPAIVILMYLQPEWCGWAAAGVFVVASATDYLDGHIARKYKLVTDFGKFIDPVADKLLVLSSLIMLIHCGRIPAWTVVLILTRELCVDGLRLISVTKGKVIAAGPLGKIKTVSQMILILWLMIFRIPAMNHPVGIILLVWTSAITLWSGIDYFVKNISVFETR